MAASFPPPPTKEIDWSNVGFKVREVNGHIESNYSVKTGKWTEPEFVADPFMRLHGMAPALNYGQQCYEGLKAFRRPDGSVSIFRPRMNARRMQNSALFVSIPSVPEEHFVRCVHLAVALNAEFVPPHETAAAMYIRPLLFGSSAQLGLNPPEEYKFVVYVMPTGVYHGVHPVDCLILEDFDRAAPHGTGSAKVGGNYAPVLRFSDRAREEGFGITLHLDSQTRTVIDEFSTSAFIGVHKTDNGYTLVVPDSKSAIKSVTSDSVCELARDEGWKVELRPVEYGEISKFAEVIAAGTAAALVPIRSITTKSKSDKLSFLEGDEPGPVCIKLLQKLKGVQLGKLEDKWGWNESVTAPSGYKQREAAHENGELKNGVMVDKLP